jgi:hypothetical protein
MAKKRIKGLSRVKAVQAKCLECIGYPADGRVDCQVATCPLYYWQPYRELDPDVSWSTAKSPYAWLRSKFKRQKTKKR